MINEIISMNGYGVYVWSAFIFTMISFVTLYSIIKVQLVKEQKITFTPRFKFDATDCFIGQNGTNKNTQFFGELYEMAMYTRLEPTLNYHTLNPGYSDMIFYYRWDE